MRTLALLAFALLLACGGAQRITASPDADGRYAIALGRHARVGFRFEETATFHSRTTQSVMIANDRGEHSTDEESMAFSARGEVMALREDGHASVLRYTLTTLERVEHGTTAVLGTPGAVLEVHVGLTEESASATLDGVPVDPATLHQIASVVDITSSGTGDEIFASEVPRRPGETWSPDMAAISRGLGETDTMRIDPARSHGVMRLLGHEERDGWPGLSIEGSLASTGIEVPMPEGATTREASLNVRFSGFFPDDSSLPTLTDQMALEVHVVIDMVTPAGPGAVAMEVTSVRQRTIHPL